MTRTATDGTAMASPAPLRRRLLPRGPGRFRPPRRAELERDGLVLLLEGVRGAVTMHDYRGPKAWSSPGSWEKRWGWFAVAVTERRLAVDFGRRVLVDVPLEDPRFTALRVTAEPGRLHLEASDISVFDPSHSGRWELSLRTDRAGRIVEELHR